MAIHEIVLNWQTTNGQTIVEVNHVNQPNDTDEALKIEQILAAYGLGSLRARVSPHGTLA